MGYKEKLCLIYDKTWAVLSQVYINSVASNFRGCETQIERMMKILLIMPSNEHPVRG